MARIVWLFSFVLGYSRLIWPRFVLHRDTQTVLRCHVAAFAATAEFRGKDPYDRKKTTAIAETAGSSSWSHEKVCGLRAI